MAASSATERPSFTGSSTHWTFLTHLVLPNLARMFNGQQQTTFPTSPKSITDQAQIPRRGAPGVGTVGAWVGQKVSPPHVPPHVLFVILWALRILLC